MDSKPLETLDYFLDGELRIIQSRQGYRFSVDALLLAEFASVKKGDIIVDLGAGCGIISIFLGKKREADFIFSIEIQKELASQAKRNIALNKLERRSAVIRGDLRHLPARPGIANIVVCNPPYRREKSGRINPDPLKALARHEIAVNLDQIISAGKQLLTPGGKLDIIYPANRLGELITKMKSRGLEPKRLQLVFPDKESNAKLVMIEGMLQAKSGIKILPPVFGQGNYSA